MCEYKSLQSAPSTSGSVCKCWKAALLCLKQHHISYTSVKLACLSPCLLLYSRIIHLIHLSIFISSGSWIHTSSWWVYTIEFLWSVNCFISRAQMQTTKSNPFFLNFNISITHLSIHDFKLHKAKVSGNSTIEKYKQKNVNKCPSLTSFNVKER